MIATFMAIATVGSPFVSGSSTPDFVEDKGVAVVFSEHPEATFELLVKPAGASWTGLPEARRIAALFPSNPWVVLRIDQCNLDYAFSIGSTDGEPRVNVETTEQFDDYLDAGLAEGNALNNFGLHGIY